MGSHPVASQPAPVLICGTPDIFEEALPCGSVGCLRCWRSSRCCRGCRPGIRPDSWPTRPVTMVVGFAAGGGTDVLGRIVGRKLSEVLGQQVIIENVGGAGGMVGSARVAKAPPDGYTIVMGTPRRRHQPDALQEAAVQSSEPICVPVVLIADQPTHADHAQRISGQHHAGVHRLREKEPGDDAVRLGRRRLDRHDRLPRCSTPRSASTITHVPYRGGGPAMQDIIGGRVDYICTLTGSAVPLIESKTVKAIAVLTKERAPMLPNVKSSWEQGFTDLEASTWFGFCVPKGTPRTVINKLHDATVRRWRTKRCRSRCWRSGAIVVAPERRSTEYLKALCRQGDREERRADPRRRPVDGMKADVEDFANGRLARHLTLSNVRPRRWAGIRFIGSEA